MLALRSVKLRYRQTILGLVWVVLQPLLPAIVVAVIFGRMVGGDFFGTNRLPSYKDGVCLVDGHWEIRKDKAETADAV